MPSLDIHVLPHRDQGHGPRSLRNGGQDASVLIDATLKEDFPPISLPKREYMETREGDLGGTGPAEAQAGVAVVRLFARRMGPGVRRDGRARHRGDYLDNADSLEQRRRSDVGMNTEVRRVDESAPKSREKNAALTCGFAAAISLENPDSI